MPDIRPVLVFVPPLPPFGNTKIQNITFKKPFQKSFSSLLSSGNK